jgi:hypothetical protein
MAPPRKTSNGAPFSLAWVSVGAVGIAFRDLPTFLRVAWPASLAYLILVIVSAHPIVADVYGIPVPGGYNPSVGPSAFLARFFAGFLPFVLLVPAFTRWIEYVALGASPPRSSLVFRRREWSYLLAMLSISLFGLVILLGTYISGMVLAGDVDPPIPFLLAMAGVWCGVYIVGRLLPLLGATALGHGLEYRDAWRETKPRGSRIAIASLFVHAFSVGVLLVAIVLINVIGVMSLLPNLGVALDYFIDGQDFGGRIRLGSVIANTINGIAYWFVCLINVVFQARVYVAIMGDTRPGDAEAFD